MTRPFRTAFLTKRFCQGDTVPQTRFNDAECVAMTNRTSGERLDAWYATACGEYALRREQMLFQRLVGFWTRRGHRLLHVGCGSGFFLEMFWEDGFDVTGIDADPAQLAAARKRLLNRADYQLGQYDHLPYDNDSFDYAAIPTALDFADEEQRARILSEALRVATKSVLVGFANRWHLFPFQSVPAMLGIRNPLSLPILLRLAREACPHCRFTIRSILVGGIGSWKEGSRWSFLNDTVLALPFGAYVGVRIDKSPGIPMTPLWLTVGSPAREQEACEAVTARVSSGKQDLVR